MKKEDLTDIKLNDDEIKCKRDNIRNDIIKKSMNIYDGKIKCISVLDLQMLFKLYDRNFFDDYFSESFNGNIKFSLSSRMTRAAGKTIYSKNIHEKNPQENYEIRMGVNFFFKYYEVNRDKFVSGINTKDSLEAFQIVFEHELIHLIELHIFKNSSCSRARFKIMAKNIFGHSDTYHQLPTNKEIACEKYNIKVGDTVSFITDGINYNGIVYKINKRAVVMVFDNKGDYRDSQGNTFSKWHVPMQKLNVEKKGTTSK